MFSNPGMSLADIAAVTRGNNNDGFGDGGGWWAWIILLALFGGWGGNGFGFGNNMGAGYGVESILQRSLDTQSILSKLDGVNSGICSLGYDQLAQMNGINQNVTNVGYNIERAIQADTVANMQNQFALSRQLSDCCCEQRQQLADLKYDMATSDCSIKTLLQQLFQQMMWGQQSGLRDLTELITAKFCNLEMSQKDAIIADLRTQLAQCGDQNMANSIVARLSAVINPPAVPAYPAANPNGCGSWPANFLTCNNGNGCCGNNWGNGCN